MCIYDILCTYMIKEKNREKQVITGHTTWHLHRKIIIEEEEWEKEEEEEEEKMSKNQEKKRKDIFVDI